MTATPSTPLHSTAPEAFYTPSQVPSSLEILKDDIGSLVSADRTDPTEVKNQTPALLRIAHHAFTTIKNYHVNTFKTTCTWAHSIESTVAMVPNAILSPLTFCKAGQTFRRVIAQTIIGKIAFATAFIALQFFHVLPYVLIDGAVSGTICLYQSDPVSLGIVMLSAVLLTQIHLIFRLVVVGEDIVKVGEDIAGTADQTAKSLNDQVEKALVKAEAEVIKANTTLKEGVDTIEAGVQEIGSALSILTLPNRLLSRAWQAIPSIGTANQTA